MIFYGFVLVAGFISWILTGLVRKYALRRQIVDVPNQRSSHTVTTPRGGGLAFVACFIAGCVAMAVATEGQSGLLTALIGSGVLVAGVGWVDDHRHVPARWRLLVHFVAAGCALYLVGVPRLQVFSWTIGSGLAGYVIGLLYLVWLLNLFNFMDGIDGIAGVEALTVSSGGIVLLALAGSATFSPLPDETVQVLLLLSAVIIGFLCWNMPKAKIFMGDVGSGFLGMVLGVVSLQAAHARPELFWGMLILLGTFIVDATLTLLVRIAHRERVYEAHRKHVYQKAARKFGSHLKVTTAYAAVNIFWLLPVAVLVSQKIIDGFFGLIAGYTPLVVSALIFRAGQND